MNKSEYPYLEKVRYMIEDCYRCGDCRTAIRPAVGRYKVCPVKEALPNKWEPFFARGKIMIANGLLKGDLKPDISLSRIIYQCTTCGSCKTICNQSYTKSFIHPLSSIMDHPKIWEALRCELVERDLILDKHREILQSCNINHNPYFEPHENRTNWIESNFNYPKESEYFLFMGCTESYRMPYILKNMTTLLEKFNIKFIISKDEWCCGSIAFRIGDIKLAKSLAKHNYDLIKSTKATKIITHCAGCYRTLKIDYPELLPDFDLEVIHITELIDNLIKEGKIIFNKDIDKSITYHDPCHLGRHSGIYDQPRFILNSIPGLKLIEMKRIKENSWCCGAGGGVKSAFPDLAKSISLDRIIEAMDTNAEALITCCPFCLKNFKDGVTDTKSESLDKIEILDILDIILDAL